MNYKQPQDKTAAYLSRDGKLLKMDKESVRRVCGRPRLRNTAKLAFFGLQPYFHDGDGLLLHPLEHVSQELGTTKDKLSEDIDILVGIGFLRRTKSGLLYDPVSYKLITKKEEPADAEFCKISQDSAKFGENLHSSPEQIAALDQIRASSLDASNAASKERSNSISDQSEADRKKEEGSLVLPSLFPALKMKDIEEVRQANLDLDWSDVIAIFLERNQKTDVRRVNRKWFERFVAGYRQRKGGATASAGQASKEDEEIRLARLPKLERVRKDMKGGDHTHFWMIGEKPIELKTVGISEEDFINLCENMPEKTEAEACAYLRKLTGGKEWNTKQALHDFEYDVLSSKDPYITGDLFWKLGDKWRGVYYETEQEKAERLENERIEKLEKDKAAAAAQLKKERDELARQQAERVQREKAEEERKESSSPELASVTAESKPDPETERKVIQLKPKRVDIDSDLSKYDYQAYLVVHDRSFRDVTEAVDRIGEHVSRIFEIELTSDAAWRLFYRQKDKNNVKDAFGGKVEGRDYQAA